MGLRIRRLIEKHYFDAYNSKNPLDVTFPEGVAPVIGCWTARAIDMAKKEDAVLLWDAGESDE